MSTTILTPQSSALRIALDPYATLPKIWLESNEEITQKFKEFPEDIQGYVIRTEAETLGEAALGFARPGMLAFKNIEKRSDIPRNGTGLAAYLIAIENAALDGYGFCTDILVSTEAKRRWEKLISGGFAYLESPFHFDLTMDVSGQVRSFYTGFAHIPPENVHSTL